MPPTPRKVDLIQDVRRLDKEHTTGIYIRARAATNASQWVSTDLATLDRESVLAWLKSRGGDNPLAESTCLILLGHEVER